MSRNKEGQHHGFLWWVPSASMVILIVLAACTAHKSDKPVLKSSRKTTLTSGITHHMQTGYAHFKAGHYGLALEAFKQALIHDPTSVMALNGIGASYDMIGQHEIARRYFIRALRSEPKSAQTLNNIGYSFLLEGDLKKARPYLDGAAAAAGPGGLANHRIIKENIAVAHRRSRDANGAAPAGPRPEVQPLAPYRASGADIVRMGEHVYALHTSVPLPTPSLETGTSNSGVKTRELKGRENEPGSAPLLDITRKNLPVASIPIPPIKGRHRTIVGEATISGVATAKLDTDKSLAAGSLSEVMIDAAVVHKGLAAAAERSSLEARAMPAFENPTGRVMPQSDPSDSPLSEDVAPLSGEAGASAAGSEKVATPLADGVAKLFEPLQVMPQSRSQAPSQNATNYSELAEKHSPDSSVVEEGQLVGALEVEPDAELGGGHNSFINFDSNATASDSWLSGRKNIKSSHGEMPAVPTVNVMSRSNQPFEDHLAQAAAGRGFVSPESVASQERASDELPDSNAHSEYLSLPKDGISRPDISISRPAVVPELVPGGGAFGSGEIDHELTPQKPNSQKGSLSADDRDGLVIEVSYGAGRRGLARHITQYLEHSEIPVSEHESLMEAEQPSSELSKQSENDFEAHARTDNYRNENTMVVEVSNGAGRRGLARRTTRYLEKNEIPVRLVTNAPSFSHPRSTIFYVDGYREQAKELSQLFPIFISLEKVLNQFAHLRLELGGDILNFDRSLIANTREAQK